MRTFASSLGVLCGSAATVSFEAIHRFWTLDLRIIAGKYRGRNLKSPPSLEVRPTSDRLRETLFNVIAPRIAGARFLDLCAGSGAIGIEALSRGAAHATFVDRSRKMIAVIEANLELCRIAKDERLVIQAEATGFVKQAARRLHTGRSECWDVVFFDPPYSSDYLEVLELFSTPAGSLITETGLLVAEHHHKNELPNAVGNLRRTRVLKQGDAALSFYESILQ